jgi:hypothetical protein
MAEVHVSRTHRRLEETTTGFEDREGHRTLRTSQRNASADADLTLLPWHFPLSEHSAYARGDASMGSQ